MPVVPVNLDDDKDGLRRLRVMLVSDCSIYCYLNAFAYLGNYRSGTVNSKSFVSKVFLPIKW